MRMWAWAIGMLAAGMGLSVNPAAAGEPLSLKAEPDDFAAPADTTASGDRSLPRPFFLAAEEPADVYPEIMPQQTPPGVNRGGVNFGLDFDWMTDYVYRGVDQNTPGYRPENSLQFKVRADFDLGQFPHPFIGLFVNVFNSDPISRFEEVRPFFGGQWTLRPITFAGGYTSYIYPNRKNLDTQEVFASISLDDSRLFNSPTPIFSPYVYGAYDLDLYKGFYLETGVKHDFVLEDYGVILTPMADVAYVVNDPYFQLGAHPIVSHTGKFKDWGLQHYDAGLVGTFSLNHLFNVDHRYGEWSVKGTIFYTGRLDVQLRADTLTWGGVGLEFRY